MCLLSLYIFIHSTEETKKIGFFNKQKLFDLCRMSLYLQYIIFLLGKGLAGFLGFFLGGGGILFCLYLKSKIFVSWIFFEGVDFFFQVQPH